MAYELTQACFDLVPVEAPERDDEEENRLLLRFGNRLHPSLGARFVKYQLNEPEHAKWKAGHRTAVAYRQREGRLPVPTTTSKVVRAVRQPRGGATVGAGCGRVRPGRKGHGTAARGQPTRLIAGEGNPQASIGTAPPSPGQQRRHDLELSIPQMG
ncbi:hypothetical protein [Streptomyces flaveolus]|uniref:hypothetical protein n=1 Tax=Streptomyces flaveolus TaxID=67297 RepID=UPI00340E7192